MALTETTIAGAGFLIDGKWESPNRDLHDVVNPSSGEVIAQVAYATIQDVDRAVKAAHNAFLEWREVPVVDRVQPLYKFKDICSKSISLNWQLRFRERMAKRWMIQRPKCAAPFKWLKWLAVCRA